MAQLASAPAWGAGGRRFESCCPDQLFMKFYISAKAGKAEKEVKELIDFLITNGHDITFDWSKLEVKKPYSQYRLENSIYAEKMIQGTKDADAFIMFWDKDLLGAIKELGTYIGSHEKLRIFLVGKPESERESIFETLPGFENLETLEELKKIIKIL